MLISLKGVPDSNKDNLCALKKEVDGWKKDNKTDIKMAWGDNTEEMFLSNFRDEKIWADFPQQHLKEMEFCN